MASSSSRETGSGGPAEKTVQAVMHAARSSGDSQSVHVCPHESEAPVVTRGLDVSLQSSAFSSCRPRVITSRRPAKGAGRQRLEGALGCRQGGQRRRGC